MHKSGSFGQFAVSFLQLSQSNLSQKFKRYCFNATTMKKINAISPSVRVCTDLQKGDNFQDHMVLSYQQACSLF